MKTSDEGCCAEQQPSFVIPGKTIDAEVKKEPNKS
jgi:hypothetical protein